MSDPTDFVTLQDAYPCAASALDRMAALMDLSSTDRAAWWNQTATIEDIAEFYHGKAQVNAIIFDVLFKELDAAVRQRWPNGEFVPVFRAHESEQLAARTQVTDVKPHVLCALPPDEREAEVQRQIEAAEAREQDARNAREGWFMARQELKSKMREANAVIQTVRALVPEADVERAVQDGILLAKKGA